MNPARPRRRAVVVLGLAVTLTGALSAAREARGADAEMAQLREAIADIGARVAHMGEPGEMGKRQ